MTSFEQRFPNFERLVLRITDSSTSLPPAEYAFSEWFCEDPDCDCRRALLMVCSPQRPGEILATINYGWESEVFYTRWMHGDAQAGREIAGGALDPLNPNSELADALLEAFRNYVRHDPFYPEQLRRHYEMFKSTLASAPVDAAPPVAKTRLTPDEIIRQLGRLPEKCDFAPYQAALQAAAGQREALTPLLIAAIESAAADPIRCLNDREDCLHEFAILLLAQFREPRALDAFLRFFSLPDDQALDLTGDQVTENGAAVLASVCGGDPAPLLRLAQDENVSDFVRGQAIEGLLVQCIWGERPRDAVIADLRRLFSILPKPGDGQVWAALVGAVDDFNAPELLPEVRQAFAEDLVDRSMVSPADVDPLVVRTSRKFPPPSKEQRYQWLCERNSPIDAVSICSGWYCFSDDIENDDGWDSSDDENFPTVDRPPNEPPAAFIPKPYVAPPKVGRNEPCPCGSGKKYKKCCGK